MNFEWDADKAEENQRKHKVSFSEAAETFSDPHGFTLRDDKHSSTEDRYYWIGKSGTGRVLELLDLQSGVILESYIMKKPKLKNLKSAHAETRQIRANAARQKSIKITININAETLAALRSMANETGIPYQRLINRTLSEGIAGKSLMKSRLDDLEKELRAIKKKIAA